jgi:hypothetical protein
MNDVDTWLANVFESVIATTPMVRVTRNLLINPSDIVAISAVGHFDGATAHGGAVDFKLQLKGGGSVEANGLDREQVEALCKAYIQSQAADIRDSRRAR